MGNKRRGRQKPSQRAGQRRLSLETLEQRLVLDSQIAAALGAAAGGLGSPDPGSATAPVLVAFETEEQLRQYLVDAAVTRHQGLFGQPTWSGWWPELRVQLLAGDTNGASVSPQHGGTNVQVPGVDEGDFVKTDGSYLYLIDAQNLTIIDLRNPTELQIAARVPLDQQLWSRELYLSGDRLTIISQRQGLYLAQPERVDGFPDVGWATERLVPPFRYDPTIHVAVYDVADRSQPKLLEQIEIEGTLLESRAIGSFVYLVTQESFELPYPATHCTTDGVGDGAPGNNAAVAPSDGTAWTVDTDALLATRPDDTFWPWPGPGDSKCVYESQDEYVASLADFDVRAWLPSLQVVNGEGHTIADRPLASVQDLYRIDGQTGTNLVTIVAIDLEDVVPDATSQGVFLDYVSEVYANESSIYLAGTTWDWNVDSPTQSTVIARFDVNGADVAPRSIGSVPGQPLNQFSLDEHDGYLRIATTQGWGDAASNQLYVLHEENGRLGIVGQLPEALASGERIFAARFLGDRAYLVTFRQVDPLFVIDLSDPTAPTVLGQLKIPGFSQYLHLVDDDLLLGFGRDADPQTGAVGRPQLSLFDVSDPLVPDLAAQFVFDVHPWSYSEALYDHHAVGYFPAEGILAIPFDTYAGVWESEWERPGEPPKPSMAFWVFTVTTTPGSEAFELLGKIEHSASCRRSFAVGDNLITVSTEEVQVHLLRDPATRLDRLALRAPAVADEFWVRAGSGETRLDVLWNDRWHLDPDFAGISSVTAPSHGGSVAVSEDQRFVVYIPAADFVGTETFVYTVGAESAEVQVHVQQYQELVRIRLQPVDVAGNEILVVDVGQEFRLNVLVEDLRDSASGVFGAWVDIEFDPTMARVAGDIERGTDYRNGVSGSFDLPGLIDELGGFASMNRLGAGERLLASIPLVAAQEGVLDFIANGADDLPLHDITLYDLNRAVGQIEVEYVGAPLTVSGSLQNRVEPTDTDGDGNTTPLDALRVVNFLNQHGSLAVSAARTALLSAVQEAGSDARPIFYDVNGDGYVTPMDVLHVVNRLNQRSLGGEGELAAFTGVRQTVLIESDNPARDARQSDPSSSDPVPRPIVAADSRASYSSERHLARSVRLADRADELEAILDELVAAQLSPERASSDS